MIALAEIRRIVIEELTEGRDLRRDDQGITSHIADRSADWLPESDGLCPECARATE